MLFGKKVGKMFRSDDLSDTLCASPVYRAGCYAKSMPGRVTYCSPSIILFSTSKVNSGFLLQLLGPTRRDVKHNRCPLAPHTAVCQQIPTVLRVPIDGKHNISEQ
jgi:hypothetical protein